MARKPHELLLELSSEPVTLHELTDALDGRYVDANEAACRLLGHAREELRRLTVADLAAPGPPPFTPDDAGALRDGAVLTRSARLRAADGRVLSVELRCARVEAAPGAALVASVLRELAAPDPRATRERQLRLERLESMGRLAAGIAHDFNNRLAVILSCADELRRGLPAGSAELQEVVDDLVVAGAGARKLMSQLLTFAHDRPVPPAPIDLNEVMRRCERELRATLPGGVDLVVTLEPSPWPVVCDPTGVERAVMNLAQNAREALQGRGRLTLASANVHVDERLVGAYPFLSRGPYVRLTVSDSGPGMTPEVKAHAFEPFFTTKPFGEALGLGLATTYGMVRQSGGVITLESEPGRGTTLELYFPRATSQDEG